MASLVALSITRFLISTLAPPCQRWYEGTNNHRKLTWLHSLGHCTLKAHYANKSYDIVLATPQAAILLLFNQGEHRGTLTLAYLWLALCAMVWVYLCTQNRASSSCLVFAVIQGDEDFIDVFELDRNYSRISHMVGSLPVTTLLAAG